MDNSFTPEGYEIVQPKSLWQYFVECFTKHYANFSGRARRREYWGAQLFVCLISLSLFVLGLVFASSSIVEAFNERALNGVAVYLVLLPYMALMGIFWLIWLVPGYALLVRRLHDRGLSGKLVLVQVVSQLINIFCQGMIMYDPNNLAFAGLAFIVNLAYLGLSVYIFVQTLLDSKPGANKYGENPKGITRL